MKSINKHHIIPKSRGGRGKADFQKVPRILHNIYHWLFFNRLPSEIIIYFVKEFWQNQIGWVKKHLRSYMELILKSIKKVSFNNRKTISSLLY